MDQPTDTVKIRMKFLDKVKVVTFSSKEEPHDHLSSMENLKKLVYRTLPELEKLCDNTSSWRRLKLEMKCEDGDGDLITLESDEDLKSFLQWQKGSEIIFDLDTKKDISDGSTNLGRSDRSVHCWSADVPSLLGRPDRSWDASSSTSNLLIMTGETRAKRSRQQCRYYARGHCMNGANCGFSHEQDRNGGLPQQLQPSPWSLSNRGATGPPREITNFGVWLREQLERDPIDNITFLSSDKGFDVLAKMVERKNLPSQWIDLLVRLLTRDEFRLSLMREHTNKIYGLLIGSTFLLQLHVHIMTQLRTANPQEIMPHLLLMDELQTRTTNGWKEVPLDGINSVIQQLDESGAKKELVVMVNRLIEHRNKLHRQAKISSTDDETQFLGAEYREISIVPNKSELLQPHMSLDLPVNLVGKRYRSLLSYLETHFRLLREDCIDPLRQGICAFRNKQSSRELCIYQPVRVVGYGCGVHGVDYRLSFQGNGRNLEGSKRLLFGALVCLSYDEFQDSFIFGVVTESNFQGVGMTKYSVCIRLMGGSRGQEEESIAEHRTYVMVESTTAYFEAYYHVLKSLQREDMEDIPFTKYLLDLEQQVDPPFYLKRREKGDEFDFESVFPLMTAEGGRSVINILQDWPEVPSSLDQAQLQALKHGLTKELAIIQGPPGTGKTFLGLLLVRLLLVNFKPAEQKVPPTYRFGRVRKMQPVLYIKGEKHGRQGPILVICMTNHALDQFLEGIFKFESNIIRIGGRSKSTVLEEMNLKKLLEVERLAKDKTASAGHRVAKGKAWSEKAMLGEKIEVCTKILNAKHVTKSALLYVATDEQIRNLFSIELNSRETVERWLAGDVLPPQEYSPFEDMHFDNLYAPSFLDSDDELEDLLLEKNERKGKNVCLLEGPAHHQPRNPNMDNANRGIGGRDGEDDEWRGMFHQFQAMNLGEVSVDDLLDDREKTNEEQEVNLPQSVSDEEVHNEDQNGNRNEVEDEAQNEQLQLEYLVDFPDVWRLNQEQRRILHEYWLHEIKMKCRKRLQILTEQYEKSCKVVNEIDEEIKLSLLRRANVVGMTTTTAARCQKILQALNSEIVIVEEAAEVLEAHVLAGLNSCVKHLVLIGDHEQLRPSTAVYRLAMKHKLDVSMFERLLEGGVEHVALQEQRRMRPSFARLVKSLYPNLKDHESVTKYENVKGMNSNLLFFDHTAEEKSITVDTSKVNTTEAKLVVELTLYLLKQDCYSGKNITILTMYSGQITEIRRILKERASATLSRKYLDRVRKMQEKLARLRDDDNSKEDESVEEKKVDDIMKLLPRVSSVDDFQGEEADIIILSLVRSNDIQTNEGEGTIGFLKTSNRICVALTRAKKGMYIFGNATLLAKRSDLWNKVIRTLQKDNALDTKFEFCCQNHPDTKTIVRKEEDFRLVADGGCSRPCEVQLHCGHVCPRSCHPGSHDEVICPKPCIGRYESCGHNCSEVCHGSNECPPCSKLVIKTVQTCGHSQRMKCSTEPIQENCQTPCPKILECGHRCDRVCGVSCTKECMQKVVRALPCGHTMNLPCHQDPKSSFTECMQKVVRALPCGHTMNLPCHQDPKSSFCKAPCQKIFSGCEHQCQGNCGLCKMGTDHIPCLQKCVKILPCGHACEAGCSAPCPPCKRKCQKRCVHSMCQLRCGQLCVPCREPCAWRCEHHQCELLCHEICTRPRCDAPCKQVLSCGHPCIGLCGDPCPTKCRICDGDTLEIITHMTLAEFEVTDRFHQLQDCRHLFEVSGLDTWMDGDDIQGEEGRKSTAVKMKECPQCKMPVWRSARYASVVKDKLAKLEAVRVKMNSYEKIRQGQQELERRSDPMRAYFFFVGALKLNPALMEAHFGAGQALCKAKRHARGAVFFSFIVKKSSYVSKVESVLKSTSDLDKVVEKSKVDCPAPKDEFAVKAMLQLASVLTVLGDFTDAEKLCEVVLKSHPDNKDAMKVKADAGNRLKRVIQVMSLEVGGPGHWYQCPNGHYYTNGECRNPMQESKCPDCKATVGGASHILVAGNKRLNIEGASTSA